MCCNKGIISFFFSIIGLFFISLSWRDILLLSIKGVFLMLLIKGIILLFQLTACSQFNQLKGYSQFCHFQPFCPISQLVGYTEQCNWWQYPCLWYQAFSWNHNWTCIKLPLSWISKWPPHLLHYFNVWLI